MQDSNALLQKTVTTDFLTKKRVVNNGIVPQYYVEGSHEAIIPKDIFMMVQSVTEDFYHRDRRKIFKKQAILNKIVEFEN